MHKSKFYTILGIFLIAILLGGLVPVDVLAQERVGIITGDVVNIRSGPGTSFAKVSKAGEGQQVTIIGEKNNWFQVKDAKNTVGWIANWLVKVDSEVSPQVGYINGNVVNVRQGAGTTYPRILQLNKGEQVVIKDQQNDWYLIDSPKGSGWIASWLINIPAGVQASRDVSIASNNWQTTGGLAGKTIVLDPGHGSIQPGGWADPGAIGKILGVQERDVNLDVALQVQQYLKQQGANVIMTHVTGTTHLSLAGRADVANKNNADIFVSIHVNSHNNTAYSGTSVYYYAPTWDKNLSSQKWLRQTLASSVQGELVRVAGRQDLGTMEANFAVLRETQVPSILVETAFVSNPTEEKLLNTADFRAKLAWGVYKGIEKYFNEL